MKVFLVERNDNVLDDEFKGYVIIASDEAHVIQHLPHMNWGNWKFDINNVNIIALGIRRSFEIIEPNGKSKIHGHGFA